MRHVRRVWPLRLLLAIFMAAAAVAPVTGVDTASAAEGPTGVAAVSGRVVINRRGAWRELALPTDKSRDLDLSVRIASDRVALGRGHAVTVVGRRMAPRSEYRVRLRYVFGGGASLGIVRLVNGQRTVLREQSPVADIVRQPGTFLGLRVQILGSSPIIVRAKLWPGDRAEPVAWSTSAADGATALIGAGWMGLRFAVPRSSNDVPVAYSYDRLALTSPSGAAGPAPTPAPTPTPTATATPAPTPTATPTPTPTPTPTAAPTSPAPPSSSAPALLRYVAPWGSDAAAGTEAAPWRTIQRAADSATAGTTVIVRGGRYDAFVVRRSGSQGAPITFAAYTGEQPVVDGARSVAYTVRLSGVTNVRIVGLTVTGGYAENHSGGGIMVENSSAVELRNNLVLDNKAFGIRSQGSTNVLIDNNEVTHNAVGIHVGGAGQGTVVSNNLIHDNDKMMVSTADVAGDDAGGEGVALVRTTGTVTVRGNYLWGNRAVSPDYGYDGGAFSIYAASNWVITSNVTWDNRNVLETGTDAARTPCDSNEFSRNLNYGATTVDRTVGMVLRCASNTLVANNTFRGMQDWVFAISHFKGSWGGSVDGLRIVNNVISVAVGKIYGIDTDLPASVVIDYNVVHNSGPGYLASVFGRGGTTNLATLRSWTGFELHGVTLDPRFVNQAANDYRLSSDSPAIDSGMVVSGLTEGYSGVGPDRGYAEFR